MVRGLFCILIQKKSNIYYIQDSIIQESERAVLGRIVLTWGLGLVLASPIPVLAVVDIEHVMAAHDR